MYSSRILYVLWGRGGKTNINKTKKKKMNTDWVLFFFKSKEDFLLAIESVKHLIFTENRQKPPR